MSGTDLYNKRRQFDNDLEINEHCALVRDCFSEYIVYRRRVLNSCSAGIMRRNARAAAPRSAREGAPTGCRYF